VVERVQYAAYQGHAYVPARKESGHLLQTANVEYSPDLLDELKEAAFMLMAASTTSSTLETYSFGLKKFFQFREARRLPQWFSPDSTLGEMEEELLHFYTFYAVKCNYSYNTLHGYLYAVRKFHEVVGVRIDLTAMKSLLAARQGWKRIAGGGLRTIAVTSEMVVEAIVNGGLDLWRWDDCLRAFHLSLSMVNMLRAGETLDTGSGPDPVHCLRVKDLVGYCRGSETPARIDEEVDELVQYQVRSKADQEGRGAITNVFADENRSPACTVALFNRLRAIDPTFFSEPNREAFVFTMASGKVLKFDGQEKLLKAGAVRLGFKSAGISLHSLRAGGATAMWHAGFDAYAIQGRGRWRSNAYKTYIWDGRERARDVATRVWASRPSLLASLRQRAAAAGL
jgi:hypothetical protein